MGVTSITTAQRQALRDTLLKAAVGVQDFAEDGRVPSDTQAASIETKLNAASAAMVVAGISGIPAGSAVIANAVNKPLLANDGTTVVASSPVTVVTNGVFTGLKFASAASGVVSTGGVVDVNNSANVRKGSGTVTVAANVVTKITLPTNMAAAVTGEAVTVPITFVTARAAGATATVAATLTIANGVITAISIA